MCLTAPLFAHREIGWRRDGSGPATVMTHLRPPHQWELNPTPVFHWLQPKNVGLQSQCLQIVHRSGGNGPGRRPASMQRVHEYSQSAACISPSPQAGSHTAQRKEERQDAGPGLRSAGMKPPGMVWSRNFLLQGASLAQKRVPWVPLLRMLLPTPLLCHPLGHSPILLSVSSPQGNVGVMAPSSPLITPKPPQLPVAPVVPSTPLTCSNPSV